MNFESNGPRWISFRPKEKNPMTIWINDADHHAAATVIARLQNEGMFEAFAEAIARSRPCPFSHEHTSDGIKIVMGEVADTWPLRIMPDLIAHSRAVKTLGQDGNSK
jgi:hypothetical protein